MKKYLIIGLSIISSLFFVSNVKAEDITSRDYYLFENESTFYNNFDYSTEFIDTFSKQLIAKWEKDYKKDWPYYYISIARVYNNDSVDFSIRLGMLKAIPIVSADNDAIFKFGTWTAESVSYPGFFMNFKDSSLVSETYVDFNHIAYLSWVSCSTGGFLNQCPTVNIAYNYYLFSYYDSNFDMLSRLGYTLVVKDLDGTKLFSFDNGGIIPTYKDIFVDKVEENYVEVDLNSYPYIILSLKDYSKTEEFSAINYVKGQYCLTSVYNYGSTEKKDIIEGSKNKRCSLYYDNYTPIRTYILNSDLKNNAIYYLKAYDTTKENKVKIDTSVFNIHYVSEEEKNNPIITINGKKHTPKSYDELTDTATKSEDENYADGASEEFTFSDIFTAPLEFLKTIWNSITQFFQLINQFISLLPETLQAFLYMSFMLAIILGLIKIIL